jgi:hypothetical protein
MILARAWRALGRLGGYTPRWLAVMAFRASTALRPVSYRIAHTHPVRIVAAVLLGMAYGPMTATVIGVIAALAAGIIKGRPDISQLGAHLLPAGLLVTPIIGLTVGYVALGIGGIAAAACAAVNGGIGAGLEWAIFAGLGTALGLALASAPPEIVALGLAFGGVIGGSAGFVVWLVCTSRRRLPLSLKAAGAYAIALALIAGYVLLITDQIVFVPST